MNETVKNSISQGMLARLLATENITVHVGDFKTAAFNVETRTLLLPSWNIDDKNMSDLLIGHEVGHALFTPKALVDDFIKQCPGIPFSILNILEDVRIERKIQERFPGLISSFRNGYDQFLKRDFFKIRGIDPNQLGFVNRLNIKAKCGNLIDISFSDEEQEIFDRIKSVEDPSEFFPLCKEIYELIKAQIEEQKAIEESASSNLSGGDANEESKTEDDPTDSDWCAPEEDPQESDDDKKVDKTDSNESGDDKSDEKDDDEAKSEKSSGADASENEGDSDLSEDDTDGGDSETDSEGDENTSDSKSKSDNKDSDSKADGDEDSEDEPGSSDMSSRTGNEDSSGKDDKENSDGSGDSEDVKASNSQSSKGRKYSSLDKELDSSTLDNLSENLNNLQTNFGSEFPLQPPSAEQLKRVVVGWREVLEDRIASRNYRKEFLMKQEHYNPLYVTWKKNTKKKIQGLVTDFERRKSAYQYSRAMQSDCGDIDVNRLHAYRYDDQIFRSVTKLADAKSHGMMFIIDYSMSMADVISSVIEQTLNLTMFCRAVGIPFQVFGFTTRTSSMDRNDFTSYAVPNTQLSIADCNIFELLSSDMKNTEFELACRHLHAQMLNVSRLLWYSSEMFISSRWEILGGTPLNATLVVAHTLINDFKKKHNVQRMNLMVLTDGVSANCASGYAQSDDYKFLKGGYKSVNTCVINGRNVKLPFSRNTNERLGSNLAYANLIENLKITCGVTTIGFFVSHNLKEIKSSIINSVRTSKAHIKAFEAETKSTYSLDRLSWGTATAKTDSYVRAFRKEKITFIPNGFNYDGYFVLDAKETKVAKDDSFMEGETDVKISYAGDRNKIVKAFSKVNSQKKESRIFLAKFAELIS